MRWPNSTARNVFRLTNALLTRRQPVYVIYEVTNRCNLRCRMCSVWRRANPAEELDLAKVERLAQRLEELGVVVVSISGGEPLMREDLPEVVRIFKRRGIITRLLTNAVGADETIVKALVDAGLDSVSISLNTLFPEEEAFICRSKIDLWPRVIEGMTTFSRLLNKPGSLLAMSVCVSSINVDELPLLEEFAAFLGFKANFMPTELAPNRESNLRFADYAPDIDLSGDQRLALIKSMDILLKRRKNGSILNSTRFLKSMRRFILQPGFAVPCDAGRLYFVVDPAGRYSICHEFEPSDSVLSPGFVTRFTSKRAQQHAAQLRNACRGCLHPCWIEVTNTFSSLGPFLQTAAHYLSNYRRTKPVELDEALRFANSLRQRLGRGPRTPSGSR